MSHRIFKKAHSGFTLAELLITLAMLGVIATFTIPKIMQSQQNERRKAVFRETFGALSQPLYHGVVKGQITDLSEYWIYLQNNLNAVKFCTNANTQGCWSGSTDNANNDPSKNGILMHNGAMVTDFEPSAVTADNIWIDWNGREGPNLHCDDQIPVAMFANTATKDGIPGWVGQIKYRINPPGLASRSCSAAVYDDL